MWRKVVQVEGSPAYPNYPERADISHISLQNLANRLYEKQKVGSVRKATHLAGSPFCDGRFTNLAGTNSPHILAQPGQLRRGETIRECASAVLDNQIPCRACTIAVD